MLSDLWADLRFTWRTLRRSPGVIIAAVLALALGIGANSALFSVVDGVLLRPLPLPDPDSLVSIGRRPSGQPAWSLWALSWPQLQDLEAQTRTLAHVGGWVDGDINFTGAGVPERVLTRVVTPGLLPALGVQPALGRNFLAEETTKGRDHVVLLGWALWQRQFGGAADVVGRSVQLDGARYEIVGVLPRGLRFERAVDLWLPLDTSDETVRVRNMHFLQVVGRVRPGVTAAQVAADLDAISRYEVESFPDLFPPSVGFELRAIPYLLSLVGDVRLMLLVLLGAVAFVLLIACANVANLLLARAAAREREIAIRSALGASRGRIVRQLLTEGLVLSFAGAALGLLFASWGIDALLTMTELPRAGDVGLHGEVVAFTVAIAVATGIGFGLAPALGASRLDLQHALKEGTRGTTGSRGGRLRRVLVVSEVALSMVLLVGAGLMVRSFVRLRGVDPGFRPEHVLMFRVSLPVPGGGLPTDDDQVRFASFYRRALLRLQGLPGVATVGGCDVVPLDGMNDRLIDIEGYTPGPRDDRPDAQGRQVVGDWFATLGIPLVEGRLIGPSDDAQAPKVVVVNRAFVERWLPKGDAIGRRIRLSALGAREFPWATVVGVVGDVRAYGLDRPPLPEMYFPALQSSTAPTLAFVLRTRGEPEALAATVRAAMRELDPLQPLFDLQPLEKLVGVSLGQRRFTLALMTLFGLVALILAAVGIYGVMAYTVAQRTQELGIRMALGATPGAVLRLVLRDGLQLVALGLVIGGVGAWALARVVASLLYGVEARDPITFAAIAVMLTAVAALAVVLPARRAMRVDPMVALRAD